MMIESPPFFFSPVNPSGALPSADVGRSCHGWEA